MIITEPIYRVNGVNGPIEVNLNTEAAKSLEKTYASVVIPFYRGELLMTYHPGRKGWEFPGGRREHNESSQDCVVREAFEEAGAVLGNIQPIGYYTVDRAGGLIKTALYTANVERFTQKPDWSETGAVGTFNDLPEELSFKDGVYRLVLNYLGYPANSSFPAERKKLEGVSDHEQILE